MWCWRRLLRVLWTSRRSNQSIPKEISPEYSLEGLMLKLKLQYFGHLIRKPISLEETLMLGKTEGKRRRRWQRMSWLGSITDSIDMNLGKLQEIEEDRGAWCASWGHKESNTTEQLNDMTLAGNMSGDPYIGKQKDKCKASWCHNFQIVWNIIIWFCTQDWS